MVQAADIAVRGKRPIPVPVIGVAAIVIAAGLTGWLLLGRGDAPAKDSFTGYVVSNDLYMASPVSGTLAELFVKRGQRIAAGDPLFRIDPTVRAAEAEQARAVISANSAQVDQQEAALARARADLAAAQADVDRDDAQLKRLTAAQQEKQGAVAALDIDQARATHEGALRRWDSARTQVDSAAAAVAAARAQLRQAQAGLTASERQLSELSPAAPRAGRVEDVMFKPGESVTANVPIVSIVPDGEVKVRFYVPQGRVNAYKPGRKVAIGCDGCATGMSAVVDFVASQPEYTPPIIYSLDARQKLVFLVEADPSDPTALVPGQPMDVAGQAGDLPGR